MSLGDKSHRVEEYGTRAVHAGAERVRKALHSAEDNLHQLNQRRQGRAAQPISTHTDPEQERESSPQNKVRTGIVSVNGRDVGEMHCTGGRRSHN
jgi:hypothetical protein